MDLEHDVLKDIDRESLLVHDGFRGDKQHRDLDAFSGAVDCYEQLEKILEHADLSKTQADIVGSFYSALAFRLVDTSAYYDHEKFDKAEEIIAKAESMTSGVGTNVNKAKYYIEQKKAALEPGGLRKVCHYAKSLKNLGCYLFTNQYTTLFLDARPMMQRDDDSFYKRVNAMGSFMYESLRFLAFTSLAAICASSITISNYGTALVSGSLATAIPLTRHKLRERRIEQAFAGYTIPKIKPA